MVHGWCNGNGRWSKRYNLVFVLILRTVQEVEQYLDLSLPELLTKACLGGGGDVGIDAAAVELALTYRPEKILVVLDGLDEYVVYCPMRTCTWL